MAGWKGTIPIAMLILIAPFAGAQLPVLDDDAGSGRDAPNGPVAAVWVDPGIVYSGARTTGFWSDPADHYAFVGGKGQTVHVQYWGGIGQLNVLDASGHELDGRVPPAAIAYASAASYLAVLPADGTYFIRISYFTSDVYRFSLGLDHVAPYPGVGGNPLDFGDGPIAPVVPASESDEHAVVAVVDTGINPYHAFFRAPDLQNHPSTWLEGFPEGAERVDLTLDADSHADALAQDATTWAGLEYSARTGPGTFDEHVYTFPGTRIIAGISFGEFSSPLSPTGATPVLDEGGHGTGSAGLAAGAGLAHVDGNVLIVAVEVGNGDVGSGIRWAAEQPWIDVITVSIGTLGNVPVGDYLDTYAAARAGKAVLVAAGNGFSNTGLTPDHCSTHTSPLTGPSWVTRIGAAEPTTGNPSTWHCLPVEAIARTPVPSVHHESLDAPKGHTGTSAATPNVAGHLARLILDARRTGQDPAPREALTHLLHAARPADPAVAATAEPSLPVVSLIDQGYGLVDAAALDRARGTLLGGSEPEPRPLEDAFFGLDHAARDVIWPAPGEGPVRTVLAQDDAGSGRDAPDYAVPEVHVQPGIVYGGTRYATAHGDRFDHFAFTARAGDRLHARYSGLLGQLNVLDASGAPVDARTPAATGAYYLDAQYEATLPADGTYYIRISYFTDDVYGFSFELNGRAPAPAPGGASLWDPFLG